VLVVAHRAGGRSGTPAALGPLVDLLRVEGRRPTVLLWDATGAPSSVRRARPLREVEAINRWRLPIWLGHRGRLALMRRLRAARVRWWWLRWRRCREVLLVGPLRPEVRHYLPPLGVPVVADAGEGGRDGGGEDDRPDEATLAGTRALAEAQIPGPPLTPHEVLTDPRHPRRRAARCGFDLPSDATVLGGWSTDPDDPMDGAERFLRVVHRLRDLRPAADVRGLWFGVAGHQTRAHEVAHEITLLGLEGRAQVVAARHLQDDLLALLDGVVLVQPAGAPGWPADQLVDAGIPIAAFGDDVPFPDVAALAEAAAVAVDQQDPAAERREQRLRAASAAPVAVPA